ncbi:MAG: hypothetical protein GF334_07385 [Candidatus Altiarchaeales archaeon]|nr:hypothetical protein [Candidatus Altiarchaeales archaeon]
MSWRFFRKTVPVQEKYPLIDPLKYRQTGDLERGAGQSKSRLIHPDLAPSIFSCLDSYEQELKDLSALTKKSGNPLFQGLGFYPEMGSDLFPLTATGKYGRLVGSSVHEGELLLGAALLEVRGFKPNQVLGDFLESGAIRRDVKQSGEGIVAPAREILFDRFQRQHRKIGRTIGSRDWMNYGRYLNFTHFTFLPTVADDSKTLDDYLGAERFDYVILKGTYPYRFAFLEESQKKMEKWISTLSNRYLKDDAAVLVSEVDEPVGEELSEHGFSITRKPQTKYPQSRTSVSVSGENLGQQIGEAKIHPTEETLSLIPWGHFTVYEKRG